jgi:Trk K+ transport system NAD-binding subunit
MSTPPHDGPDDPAVIVVGGDTLALSTARELCVLQAQRVTVLWQADAEFAQAVAAAGASLVVGRPESSEALERAGVRSAATILALSRDDQLNLQAALRARDANPRIRIVLRQFNRTLAHKIEQNLANCSVLSLAWHSAATYAAAALDPLCLRGLQFPDPDGPLTGFAVRSAAESRLAGHAVREAERMLGARVVAIDDDTAFDRDRMIGRNARLVVFGEIAQLIGFGVRRAHAGEGADSRLRRWRDRWRPSRRRRRRIDPILARLGIAALAVFLLGSWHFHGAFGNSWLTAAYFVLTTMTTTGYGDLLPNRDNPADVVAAMLLMLSGIVLSGLFIAFGASLLTRVQWVQMQGLRRIRRRGHIILCGAGSIGSGVIDLLLGFGKPLVVVELTPDAALVERARDQGFDLLTGDASRDDTLDLCNVRAAHSLIALTNVDTLNLEIALGARARNPSMPIVLRIAEASFAASIARHFEFDTTFSAAALAAPAFAGLSRFAGSRGRIAFDSREFDISDVVWPEDHRPLSAAGAIPIAVARNEGIGLVYGFDELTPGDHVLMIMPLTRVTEEEAARETATERVYDG